MVRDQEKLFARKQLVAEWISRAMKEHAIENPAQLARRLGGVDRRMVGRWVLGERLPSEPHMARLRTLFARSGGPDDPETGPGAPPAARTSVGLVHALPKPISAKERQMRSKLLARRWNSLVDGLPLDDLIRLLTAEESWLRDEKQDQAADETARVKDELIRLRDELRKGKGSG